MSFRLDKCGQKISKRGKVITTEGVKLPETPITDVRNSYKYLGVTQAKGSHEEAARK